MSTSNIVIVTAGAARHSASALLGEKLREAVERKGAEAGRKLKFSTHHLGQYTYDIADFLDGDAPGSLLALFEELRGASAVIAVTPIFKASYSGLFKLFWDLVEPEDIRGTPVLMAATGGSQRHLLALDHAVRPLFSYLGADTCATAVYTVPETLTDERTVARIERAAAELVHKMG